MKCRTRRAHSAFVNTDREITGADSATVTEEISIVATYNGSTAGQWEEQHGRMLRSLDRLVRIAAGRIRGLGPDEADDALWHFFQDAYHLKDWIKNDPTTEHLRRQVECELFCNGERTDRHRHEHEAAPEVTRLCADLSNGAKHLTLRGNTRRFPDSGIVSRSVGARPSTAGSSELPEPPLVSWKFRADGQLYDAVDTARAIVATWDGWLRQHEVAKAAS